MTMDTTAAVTGSEGTANWQDVMAATDGSNGEDHETTETVDDSIDVPADTARIAARLVTVYGEIKSRQSAVDKAKAEYKSRKGELESSEGERDELLTALETGVETIEDTFLVVTNYRTMTERWFRKSSGELLKECPMATEKHQVELPFAGGSESVKVADGGDSDDDLDDEEEHRDLEDQLDAALAEADRDSTTACIGNPDDTDIGDPEAVLAGKAPKTETSQPPSKPIRRRKKAGV